MRHRHNNHHNHKNNHHHHHNDAQDKNVKKRQKISDHFSRKDFVCKFAPESHSFRISAGLVGGLELLRSLSNTRINIIKGFESVEAAERSGKVKRNYHTQGLAANITMDNTSLEILFLMAEQITDFTGIGLNLDEKHIHVRVNKGKERELWVRKNGQDIIITNENRNLYLPNIEQFQEVDTPS